MVFQCGWGIANFTHLKHANWNLLHKSIPSILQVLAYGEIIPTVCQVLQYNTKRIHRAIIVGTLMTLSLQISWSGLGLSLASGASAVDTLLKASGPVRFPMWTLSISAILTTILGGYLALLSAANDFIKDFMPKNRRRKNGKENEVDSASTDQQAKDFRPENANTLWDRLKIAVAIAFPASIIACISPDIFLKVINFSGSYPILLMWGIIPPVVALKQRANLKDKSVNFQKSAGSSFRLASLVAISLAMMGSCAYSDVTSMLRRFF
jgi:tyrosine-specific transport protein